MGEEWKNAYVYFWDQNIFPNKLLGQLPHLFLPVRELPTLSPVTCNSVPVKAEIARTCFPSILWSFGMDMWSALGQWDIWGENPVGQTQIVLSIKKGKLCEEQAYFHSCMWRFSWEDVRLQVTTAILKITEWGKSSRKAGRYLPTLFLIGDEKNLLLFKLLSVISRREHPNENCRNQTPKVPN